jgi:hypothetical protein
MNKTNMKMEKSYPSHWAEIGNRSVIHGLCGLLAIRGSPAVARRWATLWWHALGQVMAARLEAQWCGGAALVQQQRSVHQLRRMRGAAAGCSEMMKPAQRTWGGDSLVDVDGEMSLAGHRL